MTKGEPKDIIENSTERSAEHWKEGHLPNYNEQEMTQDLINPFFKAFGCDIDNKEIIIDTTKNNKPNTFLRWTGSKRWFIKDHINDFLPKTFNNYHEPFLGAGSVFFHLESIYNNQKKYYLSDSNIELINAYIQLRDDPTKVIFYLNTFKNTEDDYYKIRQLMPKSDAKKAAKFIYQNRTSFNGIYRVNSKGEYNVPYGKRENVDIVSRKLLLEVSSSLKNVILKNENFDYNLRNIKKNDLVFLDPPYTVAHENNGFIAYNQKLFSWEDQERLKEFVKEIAKKKAYFILTNASHKSIIELYKNVGNIAKLSRHSQVGGRNKTRGMYNELVIFNTK